MISSRISLSTAILAALFASLLSNYVPAAAQDEVLADPVGADAITGLWIVPEKDARIEVYRGDQGLYHGKIVWLSEALDDNGKPRRDIHNKDPELAKRPLVGLHVVRDFTYDPDEEMWVDGEVYNSRNGKTYAGFMKIQDDGTLFLRGHVKGLKFLGKTNIWERVE